MAITDNDKPTAAIRSTVLDIGGAPTELLEVELDGSPEVQLLIIPGNPGAAPFYIDFMHHLAGLTGGRAAVATVSNLGMAPGLAPACRIYSLAQQVDHKVSLLRQRFLGPGHPPLVILAHSIGAYMAIHAIHRLEVGNCTTDPAAGHAPSNGAADLGEEVWSDAAAPPSSLVMGDIKAAATGMQQATEAEARQQQGVAQQLGAAQHKVPRAQGSGVIKVVALYPFLQVDPDCNRQRRLAWLTRHHALVSRLAGALGLLPVGVRRGLVRLLGGTMDAHAVDTVADVFASRDCVANGLYMGCTEFQLLTAPADWWLLQWLGNRFAVFVAPNDIWFKKWKWDEMHRKVPDVESHLVETQTHAFCVSTEQSRDLAARIVPIVEAALSSRGGKQRSRAA